MYTYIATYVVLENTRFSKYRILQIVQGRKVSWLQNSTVICWKTFAVGLLPCIAKAYCRGYFTVKVLRLLINLRKRDIFPPQMICNIR